MTDTAETPPGPPDAEWIEAYCRPGLGPETCRYLALGRGSWSCEKSTSIGRTMDLRVAEGSCSARGDNCAGRASSS